MTVDFQTSKRLSAYTLHAGDIVMARRGEVGRAAIIHAAEDGWLCGGQEVFFFDSQKRFVANT